MTKRKDIRIGDIRYINGTQTKVRIIRNSTGSKPTCFILETGFHSKFIVGCKYTINRRNLYPSCGRPEGIINAYKKKHRGWIES